MVGDCSKHEKRLVRHRAKENIVHFVERQKLQTRKSEDMTRNVGEHRKNTTLERDVWGSYIGWSSTGCQNRQWNGFWQWAGIEEDVQKTDGATQQRAILEHFICHSTAQWALDRRQLRS